MNTMVLVGSEDVRRGGQAAQQGGESMQAAASSIADSAHRLTYAIETLCAALVVFGSQLQAANESADKLAAAITGDNSSQGKVG